MTVIGYGRWDRRDGADRDRLGQTALAFCRALRSESGVEDARFYWSGIDSLVVLTQADSADVITGTPSPAVARATFALADLARQTVSETWLDARVGEQTYRAAQG